MSNANAAGGKDGLVVIVQAGCLPRAEWPQAEHLPYTPDRSLAETNVPWTRPYPARAGHDY